MNKVPLQQSVNLANCTHIAALQIGFNCTNFLFLTNSTSEILASCKHVDRGDQEKSESESAMSSKLVF